MPFDDRSNPTSLRVICFAALEGLPGSFVMEDQREVGSPPLQVFTCIGPTIGRHFVLSPSLLAPGVVKPGHLFLTLRA